MKEYWIINAKYPDLLVAQDILGVPEKELTVTVYDDNDNPIKLQYDYKIIIKHHKNEYMDQWSTCQLFGQTITEQKGYIFKSEIIVTPEDIKKWEIKNTAKKYNIW